MLNNIYSGFAVSLKNGLVGTPWVHWLRLGDCNADFSRWLLNGYAEDFRCFGRMAILEGLEWKGPQTRTR